MSEYDNKKVIINEAEWALLFALYHNHLWSFSILLNLIRRDYSITCYLLLVIECLKPPNNMTFVNETACNYRKSGQEIKVSFGVALSGIHQYFYSQELLFLSIPLCFRWLPITDWLTHTNWYGIIGCIHAPLICYCMCRCMQLPWIFGFHLAGWICFSLKGPSPSKLFRGATLWLMPAPL